MSVIGIDFGNESCYVAVAKAGGIETLANDYSLRATPSCVAFAGKRRSLGVSAKNQQITNMRNTISNFKHLLGRKLNDPVVHNELTHTSCRVEAHPDGQQQIGIRVNYLDEEHVYSPEQISGMLMTKLKETATNALQSPVHDCVIAVPFYFTNAERQALHDAAVIANWHPLRLINETTATALCYGFYKDDLPEPEFKPRHVVFVDCGHSALQVSICAFSKGKLKMIACACERIGGRDFDRVMAEHFAKEFITKYKVDAHNDQRAYTRLLAEVEKLKKQMSANSVRLPLNIECFMNEIDVSSGLQRPEMEEMCAPLFERIEATMRKCLATSNVNVDDIDSVEIVGGSSRIPMIKTLIEQVFKKQASTTLNQDEAVSRGAALMCAIMSPAIRVRDFVVADIQNYPVHMQWEGDEPNAVKQQGMEVFPLYHPANISRELILYRKSPFSIHVFYADADLPYADPYIGVWHIKDVKPNAKGEPQEIKIKFRLTPSGTVSVHSVFMVEKKDPVEEKPAEEPVAVGEGAAPEENAAEADKKKEKEKKKISSVFYELKFDVKTHGFVPKMLEKLIKEESTMISNDKTEQDRANARNELEETVYAIRNKLAEEEPLTAYVSATTREQMVRELYAMEDWLYDEEGETCGTDAYMTKLQYLRQQFDPIEHRSEQHEKQPGALSELSQLIQSSQDLIAQYQAGDKRYAHLTEADMVNISEAAGKAQRFLDEYRPQLQATSKVNDPPKTLAHIAEQYQLLSNCVNAILSRPKPKPPQPPTQNGNEQKDGQQQPQQKGQQSADEAAANKEKSDQAPRTGTDSMEID